MAGGASSSEFMVKALRPLEVCRLSRFNGRPDDSPMLSAAGWVSGSAVAPAASAPAAPGVYAPAAPGVYAELDMLEQHILMT